MEREEEERGKKDKQRKNRGRERGEEVSRRLWGKDKNKGRRVRKS